MSAAPLTPNSPAGLNSELTPSGLAGGDHAGPDTPAEQASSRPSNGEYGTSTLNEVENFRWSQRLTGDNVAELLRVFRDVVICGPAVEAHEMFGSNQMPGLSFGKRQDSRDHNPSTRVCIVTPNPPRPPTVKEIAIPTRQSIGDAAYDKWDSLVEGAVKTEWTLPMPTDQGASVTLKEFSYTESGHPNLIPRSQRDGLIGRLLGAAQNPDHDRSEEIHLGRSWTICQNGATMSWPDCLGAFSQAILGHDLQIEDVAKFAGVFPLRYARRWPDSAWTHWSCFGDRLLFIQFHARWPSVREAWKPPAPSASGLCLERDSEQIGGPRDSHHIVERRVSFAMIASIYASEPYYTLVTLADDDISVDCITHKAAWAELGLNPSDDEFVAVSIFLVIVGHVINEWHRESEATVRYITSHAAKPLQTRLLRNTQRMIAELGPDLQSFVADLQDQLRPISQSPQAPTAGLAALQDEHREKQKDLLNHVERELAALASSNTELSHKEKVLPVVLLAAVLAMCLIYTCHNLEVLAHSVSIC